ncbi:MAG: transcriptional repressor [Campylobacterales bacterium]|nr:transcriptional repressor [Campylobacterales bacterium]
MGDYISMLKQNGLKTTFQRLYIMQVIDDYGHLDIDEIYSKVLLVHPSISLATIYKNILTLVEKKVIKEVPIEGKKSKYEILKQDHFHLICIECGSVEDCDYEELSGVVSSSSRHHHFLQKKVELSVYGYCKKCIDKINEKS